MADKIFDTLLQNTLEKWLSSDANAIGDLAEDSIFELLGESMNMRGPGQFLACGLGLIRGLKVSASGLNMDVSVGAGLGLAKDVTAGWAANGRTIFRPVYLQSSVALTVPAADPVLPRTDLLIVKPALYSAEQQTKDIKDPVTQTYSGQNVFKRMRRLVRAGTYAEFGAGTCELAIQTGTPGGGIPVNAPGTYVLAFIAVGAAVAVINSGNLTDRRTVAHLYGSRPRLVGQLVGNGAFAYPAGWAVADSAGGASVSNIVRNGVGDYTVTHDGFGSIVPMIKPSLLGTGDEWTCCQEITGSTTTSRLLFFMNGAADDNFTAFLEFVGVTFTGVGPT